MPDARGFMQCSRCKAEKHTSDFHRSTLRKCGFDSRCKQCSSERSQERCNKPDYRAKVREYVHRPHRKARRAIEHAAWRVSPEGKRWIMWRSAKTRAQKAGLPFTISVTDVVVPERCPLLGVPLFLGDRKRRANSPSLDRIDPRLGYVPGNVWVISFRANAIKQDALLPELEILVRNLARRIQDLPSLQTGSERVL